MIAALAFLVAGLLAGPWPLAANTDRARVRDRQDPRPAGAATQPAPRRDVLKKLRATSFGAGHLARIEIFRHKSGAVVVLALRPDINRFTYAPHTFYKADGTKLLEVADRPGIHDRESVAKLSALLRDLQFSGSEFCSQYR